MLGVTLGVSVVLIVLDMKMVVTVPLFILDPTPGPVPAEDGLLESDGGFIEEKVCMVD